MEICVPNVPIENNTYMKKKVKRLFRSNQLLFNKTRKQKNKKKDEKTTTKEKKSNEKDSFTL